MLLNMTRIHQHKHSTTSIIFFITRKTSSNYTLIPFTDDWKNFMIGNLIRNRIPYTTASVNKHGKQHLNPRFQKSEESKAYEELETLSSQLKEETREINIKIPVLKRKKRRPPGPPDEKYPEPFKLRRLKPLKDRIMQPQGPFRTIQADEREKLRTQRLIKILSGELQYKRLTPTNQKTTFSERMKREVVEDTTPSVNSSIFENEMPKLEITELKKTENKKTANTVDKTQLKEDQKNPHWVETSSPIETKMTDLEWERLNRSLYKCLKEPAPTLTKKMIDNMKIHLGGWKRKLTSEPIDIKEPWRKVVNCTTWEQLKTALINKKASCPSFKEFKHLCELLRRQQDRIAEKYFLQQKHSSSMDSYPKDILETELWTSLLEANYGVMMEALKHPYNLSGILNAVSQMHKNNVNPIAHLTALCHSCVNSNVLLSATSRTCFIKSLLKAKIFEKRVAKLIFSRHETQDFSFTIPEFFLLHLEYVSSCFDDITNDQISLLVKPLHRALALGKLTPNEKTRMAQIYAKHQYNHLTFFKTLGKEIQQQLEIELLLNEQLFSPGVTCAIPKEFILPMRQRFLAPEMNLEAGNITDLASCTLSDKEHQIAHKSYTEWTQLKSALIETSIMFGKDCILEHQNLTDRINWNSPTDNSSTKNYDRNCIGPIFDYNYHMVGNVQSKSIINKTVEGNDKQSISSDLNKASNLLNTWRSSTYSLCQIAVIVKAARDVGSSIHFLPARLPNIVKSLRTHSKAALIRPSKDTTITLRDAWIYLAVQYLDILSTNEIFDGDNLLSATAILPRLASIPESTQKQEIHSSSSSEFTVTHKELDRLMHLLAKKYLKLIARTPSLGNIESGIVREICRWFEVDSKHRLLDKNHLPTDKEVTISNPVVPTWFTSDTTSKGEAFVGSMLDFLGSKLSKHAETADLGPLTTAFNCLERLRCRNVKWRKRASESIKNRMDLLEERDVVNVASAIKTFKVFGKFAKGLGEQFQKTQRLKFYQKWNNVVVHLKHNNEKPQNLYRRLG